MVRRHREMAKGIPSREMGKDLKAWGEKSQGGVEKEDHEEGQWLKREQE